MRPVDRRVDKNERLQAAMSVLASQSMAWEAPVRVEQALASRIDAVRRRRQRMYLVFGALAASLVLALWIAASQKTVVRPTPVAATIPKIAAQPVFAAAMPVVRKPVRRHVRRVAASEQPFIAIPYTPPLEAYERADVMRVDLPVAALIAAGLPMGMADPAGRARADLLVGQDGRARAVRLIAISYPN